MIVIAAKRLQRVMRIKHAAASGAEHVPGKVEQSKPGGVQEAGNDLLFVEAVGFRELQDVDAVELVVLAIPDKMDDGSGNCRIGDLLQRRKLGFQFTHDAAS